MKTGFKLVLFSLLLQLGFSQKHFPFDTIIWNIQAQAYVLENYKGKNAIYLQQGSAEIKNTTFTNGTIEFDVYMTERQSFPGIGFRDDLKGNYEAFFLRPHLSGKSDANQAMTVFHNVAAFQLNFGERWSFPYKYSYDRWTHIKLVIYEEKAQVFLDYSEKPHLSWIMKLPPKAGNISIGHSFAPQHYANFTIDETKHELVDFKIKPAKKIEGVIKKWKISSKFDERRLADPTKIEYVIKSVTWDHELGLEENIAADISRKVVRYGTPGNTVLAKFVIDSDKDQIKKFDFGYSDRVILILNGKPIYYGNNRWRSRDYRYLGTIGFFDGAFLHLKEGKNTVILAVSEDFGGWLVAGKFNDYSGIEIDY